MGNILDEYDEEEELLVRQPDGSIKASGFAELEDLEEMLGISMETEEYETLNGFLTGQLTGSRGRTSTASSITAGTDLPCCPLIITPSSQSALKKQTESDRIEKV